MLIPDAERIKRGGMRSKGVLESKLSFYFVPSPHCENEDGKWSHLITSFLIFMTEILGQNFFHQQKQVAV